MLSNLRKYLSFLGAGRDSTSTITSATLIADPSEAHLSCSGVGSREAMKAHVVGGEK
jgi:hypothetical protein